MILNIGKMVARNKPIANKPNKSLSFSIRLVGTVYCCLVYLYWIWIECSGECNKINTNHIST